MEWKEYNLFIPEKATDLVALLLYELGSNGSVIHDDEHDEAGHIRVTAYFPADDEEIANTLECKINELKKQGIVDDGSHMAVAAADEYEWLYAWQKYFHVRKISHRFWVEPAWETAHPLNDELVIKIEPGRSFGSGIHETTCLCVEFLEEAVQKGDFAIDIGTGTGILAIAAAKLGAAYVTAVDNDPISVEQATINVALNGVEEHVSAECSDLLQAVSRKGKKADIIVANIVSDAIVSLLSTVGSYLKDDGIFIASGIIDDRIDDIRSAAALNGFTCEDERLRNGWYALRMRWKS